MTTIVAAADTLEGSCFLHSWSKRMGGGGPVAVQEKELLELVRGFLEEQGLVEAMRLVETASGVRPKFSQEVSFLRELVLSGQWESVHQYLTPLKTAAGYSSCCFLVCKQQFLELLVNHEEASLQEKEGRLNTVLNEMQQVCPSRDDFSSLLFLLTLPLLHSHPDYKHWTVMGARLALFHSLADFLHQNLYTTPPFPPRGHSHHRLVQLVAKGLLYEHCEEMCSTHGAAQPSDSSVLDLWAWMQQQPASSFMTPVTAVEVTVMPNDSKSGRHKPTPAQSKPTLASSSMVVEEEKEGDVVQILSRSAPPIPLARSISAKESSLERRQPGTQQRSTAEQVDTEPQPLPPAPSSKITPDKLTPPEVDCSTPRVQRHDPPSLPPPSSPVPYHHGTHDTPHIRRLRKHPAMKETTKHVHVDWPKATLATTMPHSQVVRSVSFSPIGNMVAVGANCRTLSVYSVAPLLDAVTVSSCASLPLLYQQKGYHKGSIYCLDWWQETLLASGSNDQTIQLLHRSPEGQFTTHSHFQGIKCTVRDVQFMSSGLLASCGAGDSALRLSDCQKMSVVQVFHGHNCQVLAVSVVDEHRFASGGEDGSVKLWDVRSKNPAAAFSLSHSITSLSTHADQLACSTSAGTCHIFCLATGLSRLDSYTPSTNECRSIRYSPCGSWLLTGSYSGEVCLAISSSLLWQPLCSHQDKVIQCRWHSTGSLVATSGADKTARLWKLH